jgi:spore germination protein GerM
VKALIKSSLILVIIALITLTMVGCNEKQSSKSAAQSSASISSDTEQKKADNVVAVNPIEEKQIPKVTTTTQPAKKVEIELYFGNNQGDKIIKEMRSVKANSNLPKAAMEQLIAGPESKDLIDTIPEGTKILNVDIIKGVAYANFSNELSTKHWGGSAMEALTIQSIVDTLSQFNGVAQVKIMLDGSPADTIAGHIDISQPFTKRSADTILQ